MSLSDVLKRDGEAAAFKVFTKEQVTGASIMAFAAGVSTVTMLALITFFVVDFVRTRLIKKSKDHLFIMSQLGLYVFSLLVSDLMQSSGGLISILWAKEGGILASNTCWTQAALIQMGDLGSACWNLVIAIHTFDTLVLRKRVPYWLSGVVVVFIWAFVILVEVFGPTLIMQPGVDFYGPTEEFWCWITRPYPTWRIYFHYVPMYLSAFFSTILYVLVFFSLRGNLNLRKGNFMFRDPQTRSATSDGDRFEHLLQHLAGKMLWYPIGYCVLILPVSICRALSIDGTEPSTAVWTFSMVLLCLMGFSNVVILTTTRRVVLNWRGPSNPHPNISGRTGSNMSEGSMDTEKGKWDISQASTRATTPLPQPTLPLSQVPLQLTFNSPTLEAGESEFLPTPIVRHPRQELPSRELGRSNSAGSTTSTSGGSSRHLGIPIPIPQVTPEEEERYESRRKNSMDSTIMLSAPHPDEIVVRALRQNVGTFADEDRFSLEVSTKGGLPPPPRPRHSHSPSPSRQTTPDPFEHNASTSSSQVPLTPTMPHSPDTPLTSIPLTPVEYGTSIVSMYGSMGDSPFTSSPVRMLPKIPRPVFSPQGSGSTIRRLPEPPLTSRSTHSRSDSGQNGYF